MLTVPQHNVAHVAHAQTIHQNGSHGNLPHHLRAVLPKFQHVSGGKHENILLLHAQTLGDLCLSLQMLELPVYGNSVFGTYQGIDQLDLLLTGMSRHMGILKDHVRPLPQQLVDDLCDGLFVAGYGIGGKDHGISRPHGNLPVHPPGHAAQGGHALPLTARGDNHLLLVRIILQLIDLYQGIFRNADALQIPCRLNNTDHAAPFHADLAAELIGRVDDLLHPVHIGGEGGHKDPRIFMLLKQGVEGMPHRPLGGCETGTLRVGGVAHQGQNPLLAQLRQPLQVDGVSKYRCVVYLEVSRMHHHAGRGIDCQRRRVHDAVVGLDELHTKLPHIDGLAEFDYLPLGGFHQIMFLQLVLNDTHGKPCGVHRHIDILQHIGQSADMVLVPMGDHKALDSVDIVLQIGDVRNHKVYPQHIVRRKGQSAVHHNNTVFILEGSHVQPNLLQAGTVLILFSLQSNLLHILHSSHRA